MASRERGTKGLEFCLVIVEFLHPSNAEATICPKHKDAKIFENLLNHVMLVFIG